jgi:hypothetical protein
MSNADDSKVSCDVYDDMEQQMFPISFLSIDLLQYVLIPLIDARVLHYLKCTNSTWKKHIEESAPKFEFVTKFGSKGSGNGEFNSQNSLPLTKR